MTTSIILSVVDFYYVKCLIICWIILLNNNKVPGMCEIIFDFILSSLKILCEAETLGRLEMGGVGIGGAPPPLSLS